MLLKLFDTLISLVCFSVLDGHSFGVSVTSLTFSVSFIHIIESLLNDIGLLLWRRHYYA